MFMDTSHAAITLHVVGANLFPFASRNEGKSQGSSMVLADTVWYRYVPTHLAA